MAYRIEKNQETGKPEIVIDGWENGLAASPYQGITSMLNLNIRYLPGAVYSNYKRQLNSAASGIGVLKYWTQDPISGAYYIIDGAGKVWTSPNAFTAWTQLTGNAGHTGQGQGLVVYKGYLFVFKATAIDYYSIVGAGWSFDWQTGLQSATHMGLWGQDDILYFCNGSPVSAGGSTIGSIKAVDDIITTLTVAPANGDTAATLTNVWALSSGTYTIHFSDGEYRVATFTNGSAGITWTTALVSDSPSPAVQIDIPFLPTDAGTFTYNPIAVTLPGFEQSATWLSELRSNLYIAAGKRLYPFDRSSVAAIAAGVPSDIPVFIKENIVKVINILNILYVSAGVKGNIYISNGYSISPWVKLPDSFFGVIDPQIAWGDMMSHRNKLYVGACQSYPGTGGISGVFSIDLTSKLINFENQNSYGLITNTGTNGAPNVLIDLDQSTFDCYASGWYNGTSGGMDINNATIYTGGETVIETDLIPVGTFLNPKTFSNIEFKLDEPMSTSDSIQIYARQSFSASYVLMGQTNSQAVISDVYTPLALQKSQWLQFKIVLTSASGLFIRLREVRLR